MLTTLESSEGLPAWEVSVFASMKGFQVYGDEFAFVYLHSNSSLMPTSAKGPA